MNKKQFGLAAVACLLFLSTLVVAQQDKKPSPNQDITQKMTNADIVQMVAAGLSEQIITTSIRQAPAKDFDLTPTGLIALKKAGVPDAVVLVMQEVNASVKSVSASGGKTPTDDKDSTPKDPNASVREELLLIEYQMAKAQIKGDKAAIDKLLTDDFMHFEEGKSYGKAWFLEKAKPLKGITTFDIENAKLSLEGETAALTGLWVIHTQNGSTIRYRFNLTHDFPSV